ncbi:MAG: endolytic transglycosylase MltG [Rhizobiaceae bacterium]|nr:endolytic transglycosylase MltG [Rhizobiaceae bacterium]
MHLTDPNSTHEGQFGRAATNGDAQTRIIPKSPKEALRPEKVPLPPRRSREARSQLVIFLNFVMTMITFFTIAAVALVYYAFREYRAPGPLEAGTTFLVREGAGISEIADSLERKDIISNARIFKTVTTFLGDDHKSRHGEYAIKAHASMLEIMDILKSGKSIQYSVTLPEGLTVKQMFRKLAEDPNLDGGLPAELPPEGSLRPETYKFTRGSKRAAVVAQMVAAQQKLLDEVWEKRDKDLPLASKEELLILASIVEKETGKADERPQVASVFLNRIKKGMRLQSDPTIVYGLFGGDGKPSDRELTKADVDKETPYNTYRINGLPPTPIANPGRAALEAVANPSRTDYLYFVADGSGGHAFAATLDDHNANVRRWRKFQEEQKKAAEQQQDGADETPQE